MGRSKGGLTTKIHAASLNENVAVGLQLSPGNTHDAPGFDLIYRRLQPENVISYVVMDKAYDSDIIRDRLRVDGIIPVIPPRSNRKTPAEYDKDIFKQRNQVERFFNKLKHYRRLATRYDKLKNSFMAAIHIVASFIILNNS